MYTMIGMFQAVLSIFKYQVTLVNMMISLASGPSLNSLRQWKVRECTGVVYMHHF